VEVVDPGQMTAFPGNPSPGAVCPPSLEETLTAAEKYNGGDLDDADTAWLRKRHRNGTTITPATFPALQKALELRGSASAPFIGSSIFHLRHKSGSFANSVKAASEILEIAVGNAEAKITEPNPDAVMADYHACVATVVRTVKPEQTPGDAAWLECIESGTADMVKHPAPSWIKFLAAGHYAATHAGNIMLPIMQDLFANARADVARDPRGILCLRSVAEVAEMFRISANELNAAVKAANERDDAWVAQRDELQIHCDALAEISLP
jgi:hypothetical protein